ncbi:hypothetical protein [Micromonospora profundi]|uniref:hypothetical protein n=1 Tax=Micromonospora profundi TaxID=1420889 RepID=UPI0036540500
MSRSTNVWIVIYMALALVFVAEASFAQLSDMATHADNGQITTAVSTANAGDDSRPGTASGVWCC